MSPEHQKIWLKILQLHNEAKSLLLQAEETGLEWRSFLQPITEQKHAYEHIVRAQAAEFGVIRDAGEKYVTDALNKALGHEYRAFFDAADWLGVRIRELLTQLLEPYSNECICAVIPEWYREMRPKIEGLDKEIAAYRNEKDVSKNDEIIPTVQKYRAVIDELLAFHARLLQKIPALNEYAARGNQAERRSWAKEILLVILGAVLGALAAWLLGG